MKVVTYSSEETRGWGERLGKLLKPGDVVALKGDLGAGKTVLVQGIAAGLGVTEYVTSPTYLIIQEYQGRIPLFHMDLYRLEEPGELEALGYQEYFDGGGVTVLEWADRVEEFLPPRFLEIELHCPAMGGEGERTLVFTAKGERYEDLLEELKQDVDSGD